MKRLDEKLFVALSIALERHLSMFNPQNLCNFAWAFAMVKQHEKKLFMTLARAGGWRVSKCNANGFKSKDFANMLWAFTTMQQPDEKLFMAFARVAESQLSRFRLA
eukprot:gnl/TRDRNA2_/TRDRNA2_174113_c1_seq16.p2 gnl/TRDRNA2_/TRDRNA2_174113_c1~~gnl/TRDRNA2_/TRDRNA2_174113_c1_seq16.p2  ORF type:complete len:114 (+),score=21.55 gnl/TRDRNA2_/TRDRNA2_174113_c1_seq16:26-343(+)